MGSTAQYGCTVANRFAFSVDVESDEEDPFESLKKLEIKKKEEKVGSIELSLELKWRGVLTYADKLGFIKLFGKRSLLPGCLPGYLCLKGVLEM